MNKLSDRLKKFDTHYDAFKDFDAFIIVKILIQSKIVGIV